MNTEHWRSRNILPAIIVIGIGVLLLLRNMDIDFFDGLWRYWPGILIAAGLVRLVDAEDSGARVTGGVLIGAGALLLANSFGLLHLSWNDFWPLLLIGAGILMLWNRLAPPHFPTASAAASPANMETTLDDHALFGGVSRKVTSNDFRGGRASAMFGGVEIDLRRAAMRADSAVVDASTMFGGIEFKIPQNWLVISQVSAIFGGIGDKTAQPDPEMPGVKRLYVKGSVIFGGVEFKN